MSVYSKLSGSQACTLDTEHTLTTETSPGVYVLVVDTNAMVNGDITIIRIYTKDKSGGTSRIAYSASYAHIQAEPHKYSVPVPVDTEIKVSIEQTDGTGRTYDWNLLIL
jgi:hypothetical protein